MHWDVTVLTTFDPQNISRFNKTYTDVKFNIKMEKGASNKLKKKCDSVKIRVMMEILHCHPKGSHFFRT